MVHHERSLVYAEIPCSRQESEEPVGRPSAEKSCRISTAKTRDFNYKSGLKW